MILLRVLGSTEFKDADGRELKTVLAQPKRLALLVYLAATGGFHRRDTLLALFWPELDATRSRDALNQAVRFLRKELGGSLGSFIVSRGVGELGVEPGALWCDAAAFRGHIEAKRYGEALDLYRGDLLPGFFSEQAGGFEEWLEGERARLRVAAARAALEVAEAREREQSFTTAVTSARRAVELAGLDERVVRELLTRLDRLGDRAGAIHAYEEFARRLADELETEPAAETKVVIDQIRQRTVAGRLVVSKDRPGPPVDRVHPDPSPGTSGAVKPAELPRANPPTPDVELNGLRIVRELGRGGMATVHLALDVKHDRYVALKVIRPELATWVGTDRFLREIQITARLAHPHILPLIDSGSLDGLTYLVTPYVAGESLRARLHRETKLPVGDALRLATEIAEAIDYAHRCGVVHRDIKPENILLADGHAIVADFGIARAVTPADPRDSNAIPSGVVIGSPPYMSPEALRGGPVGVQADIYALGCVLVEMLVGAPPPSRSGEALASILQRDTLASRELVMLAVDCTAAEQTRRPQTAAEVVRRLELAARGMTSALGDLRPETSRAFVKALALYAVAFVVVIGLAKGANVLGAPDWVMTWAAILMGLGLPTVLGTGLAHHAARRILRTTTTRTAGGTLLPTRGRMESLAIEAAQRLTWRRTTLTGVTAIAALVFVTGTLMGMGRVGAGPLKSVFSTGALERTDQIMIGPVTVNNADSSLGAVIDLGIRIQIGDSKVIRLVPEASVNRTLPLMRLDPSAKLTPAVALDVAKRVGAKAVLDATLTGAGSDAFIISLRLVSSDSGRQLTAVQASTSVDRLSDAITSLSRQMRTRIGESLRSVNETPALSSVTTSSLDALRAYTAGRQALLRGEHPRAHRLMFSAVKLDSTFAMAWRSLAAILGMNVGFRDKYDAMEMAHRYADRLPAAERDDIEEEYYASNRFDRAAAIRLHEKYLVAGDTSNIGNTAARYESRRAFATAEALLRAEVSRDTGFANVMNGNALLWVLLNQGRFAAADSLWAQWRPHYPRRLPFGILTYATRGTVAFRRQLDSLAKAKPSGARHFLTMSALLDGRISAWASSPFAVGMMQRGSTRALDSVVNRVWPIAVMLEHPDRALRELDSASSEVSLSSTREFERTDWLLATAFAQAGNPTRAEKILADYQRQLTDTSLLRYVQPFLHTARGEILLAKKQPHEAIKEFRLGDMATDGPVNDCTICLPARLGRAFDKAEMPDSAIAYFEAYVTTPYSGRLDVDKDQSLLALITERLAQLYDQKGDRRNAAANYEKFIILWKNADPELRPRVAAARDRLAYLRR